MLALTGCFIALLYATGLRADRGATLTEPEQSGNAAIPLAVDVGQGAADSRAPSVLASGSVSVLYRGLSAEQWAAKFRHRTRQLQVARAETRRRWHPTVTYALRLASAVYGVSYSELRSVSFCESHHYPFAQNGIYKGIFQMHWSPFGFSPFDPVASALSAAQTVVHDGGWRQWTCKP